MNTIRYRGKTYGEADMAALLQALDAEDVRVSIDNRQMRWWCYVERNRKAGGEFAPTHWAALCAAVRAAGLEDKP